MVEDRDGQKTVVERVPLPEPAHTDPCQEECPPSGCPPDELRTLLLDDLDAGFTVEGDTEEHASGGYLDHFRSAALAPAGAPTVRARFTGTAPWSGAFDVAAFVPLDPATCTDVRIAVDACGAPVAFSADQNVPGGLFTSLGQVVLRQGDPVTIEVTNDSADPDASHRVGIDAFRLTWRGEADLASCDEPGEGEGEGEGEAGEGEGEGEAAEGEGEGEGDEPLRVPLGGGCGCAAGAIGDVVAFGSWLGLFGLFGRRRAGTDCRDRRPT